MAELYVTTWDAQHTFHVVHDQKRHGRRGISTTTSSGDAADVYKAATAQRLKLRERGMVGTDYRSDTDAKRTSFALESHTRYVGSGYISMNMKARNPDQTVPQDDKTLRHIGGMDDYISYTGVRNTEPITVYRGISPGSVSASIKGSSRGSVFVEDGFLSTSANIDVASEFGSGGCSTGDSCSIRTTSCRRLRLGG